MAFFASKPYDRPTFSADRVRRERAAAHGTSRIYPLPSEFGGIDHDGLEKTVLPASVPSVAGPSSSPQYPHLHGINSKSPLRTPSPASGGAGSSNKRSSHSPNPARRRAQLQEYGSSSRDGSDAGHSSVSLHTPSPISAYANNKYSIPAGAGTGASAGSKHVDAVAHTRSSPDLKAEQQSSTKSRSKMSLRAQIADNYGHDNQAASASSSTPVRPPRSIHSAESAQPSSSRPSLSTTSSAGGTMCQTNSGRQGHSPGSPSMSSSSSSPLSPPFGTPAHQRVSPSTSACRREDPTLAPPPKGYKSSGGSASDGSYGSPLSELGYGGFSVKSLLSKPAARSNAVVNNTSSPGSISGGGALAVRSESDTDGSYSYDLTAVRRRRVEAVPNSPSDYSVSGMSMHTSPTVSYDYARPLAGGVRKPTMSEPEPPARALSSIGRSRGVERVHVLEMEKEREPHTRNPSSSLSLSSPSEGTGAAYPFGLALGRVGTGIGAGSGGRRLSALDVREDDSPVTHMSFTSHSPGSVTTPSSSTNSRARPARHQPPPSSSASAGITRRADSPPPPGLTPAEIVAHAYKQQERRRAALARDVSKEVEQPAQRAARGKERLAHSASAGSGSTRDRGHEAEPPTLYYTVFGNPSGRVVAIGSARDSAWGLFERGLSRKATETEQAVVAELSMSAAPAGAPVAVAPAVEEKQVPPLTLRRKLSKKMSGRFRGVANSGGKEGRKESVGGREGKDELNDVLPVGEGGDVGQRKRPSLSLNTSSDRRSATLPREKPTQQPRRNSLKISLDSFVAVPCMEPGSGRLLPSAANGSAASPRTLIPSTWGREVLERTASELSTQAWGTKGEKGEKHDKDKDRGKLWGLVKRISSNALKDKYKRASMETPPPVPALPRDFAFVALPTKFEFENAREVESSSAVSFETASLPSYLRGRRPSTALAPSQEPVSGRFTRPKESTEHTQLLEAKSQETRPSATTRSSSPISSDIASANSLIRSQSNCSSTSSYGDLATGSGVQTSALGQHILPPEKLFMFDSLDLSFGSLDDGDAKGTAVNGYGALFFGEEPVGHQALPVPPRRAAQARHDENVAESPSIPTFSTDNAVNTFGFRSRSGTNATTSAASAFTGADFGVRKSSPSPSPAPSIATPSEPPPRPPRSAQRGPAAPSTLPSSQSLRSTHSLAPGPSARVVLEERPTRGSIGAHSQASTARPNVLRGTPSPPPLDAQSPVSTPDSASSTLMFRDMAGSAGRGMWTEKEKLDKWNDLLDRSEKAGGTLHVGLGGLLSDVYSEF